jgi:hypothetical protein
LGGEIQQSLSSQQSSNKRRLEMTEEADKQGLRPVGDAPMHADDRPVNREGTTDEMGEDEDGLGPAATPHSTRPSTARSRAAAAAAAPGAFRWGRTTRSLPTSSPFTL